jgi:serine/threonine-protein kinase RsbW
MRVLARSGCPEDLRVDMEIALREALANAIYHGNGGTRGKRVFLRCYAAPQTGTCILVRDEGAGFDPQQVPDPRSTECLQLDHGRGLFLMRALMDRVEYRRGGSEVMLFKAYVPNGTGD